MSHSSDAALTSAHISRRVIHLARDIPLIPLRHKLAPISGSVETSDASPLCAARRELEEETTLTPSSLRLRRQGKPFSFVDEALSREWTIYPFAFDLTSTDQGGKGEEGIATDWEHESWDWYDPRSVRDDDEFGGVPHLATSLRRAWFEYDLGDGAGGVLSKGLQTLQEDHESGARVLAGKALEILADVLVSLETEHQEEWWKHARTAAWHLWKNGRESMGAAILNVILTGLREIEAAVLPKWAGNSRNDREAAIRTALLNYVESRMGINDDISQSFRSYLEGTYPYSDPLKILTLSSSSTISKCLLDVINSGTRTFDIRVLESRPLFEGASMAATLEKNTIRQIKNPDGNSTSTVTVYTDAAAAIASKDVDLVLLGADMISSNGDTCNKTGSLPAVLSGRHVSSSVKVVVVADREKVFPFSPPEHEENDRAEVTAAWSSGGSAGAAEAFRGPEHGGVVKNVYFEWVDSSLIDNYVLEDGHKKAGEISEIARSVKEAAHHFLDDL